MADHLVDAFDESPGPAGVAERSVLKLLLSKREFRGGHAMTFLKTIRQEVSGAWSRGPGTSPPGLVKSTRAAGPPAGPAFPNSGPAASEKS
jgi:hypothetical protein